MTSCVLRGGIKSATDVRVGLEFFVGVPVGNGVYCFCAAHSRLVRIVLLRFASGLLLLYAHLPACSFLPPGVFALGPSAIFAATSSITALSARLKSDAASFLI